MVLISEASLGSCHCTARLMLGPGIDGQLAGKIDEGGLELDGDLDARDSGVVEEAEELLELEPLEGQQEGQDDHEDAVGGPHFAAGLLNALLYSSRAWSSSFPSEIFPQLYHICPQGVRSSLTNGWAHLLAAKQFCIQSNASLDRAGINQAEGQ